MSQHILLFCFRTPCNLFESLFWPWPSHINRLICSTSIKITKNRLDIQKTIRNYVSNFKLEHVVQKLYSICDGHFGFLFFLLFPAKYLKLCALSYVQVYVEMFFPDQSFTPCNVPQIPLIPRVCLIKIKIVRLCDVIIPDQVRCG